MEINQLPIIDWELGIKLAGGKKDLAQEMLHMFLPSLPQEMSDYHALENAKNYTELLRRIHKLRGAVAYLGLPRLKTLLSHLETDLKTNIMSSLPSQLIQLDNEINLLLEHSRLPS